jgi:hypothetical protein
MTGNKSEGMLEDILVWEIEKIKESKKGSTKYTYWIGLLAGGCKVRNVLLGSLKEVSRADAIQKSRKLKAEALGLLQLG